VGQCIMKDSVAPGCFQTENKWGNLFGN